MLPQQLLCTFNHYHQHLVLPVLDSRSVGLPHAFVCSISRVEQCCLLGLQPANSKDSPVAPRGPYLSPDTDSSPVV